MRGWWRREASARRTLERELWQHLDIHVEEDDDLRPQHPDDLPFV